MTKPTPAHPNKRKPFFTFIRRILRAIKPKCRLTDLTQGQGTPGIFLSNHSAATGPLMVELNLPYAHHPWGAYQMNGSIRERFRYLYHIFFRQKKKMKKVPAFLLSCLSSCLSKGIYKGMGLISSYPDLRLLRTLEASIKCLDKNESIVIYPEDSSDGYKEQIERFHGGFCLLSSLYYARRGVDLPVYSMYYSERHHRMVISRPS
ncbi:MAG: hypothetical protein J6125_01115 [Clostridia bacterium]|nr:hypothetical protein [Clostridia bacterium]